MSPSDLVNGKLYRIDKCGNPDQIHDTGVFEGRGNKEGYEFKLTDKRTVFVNLKYVSEIGKKFETIEKIAKDYFGIVSLNSQNGLSRLLLSALGEAYDEGRWQLQEEIALDGASE